MNDAYSTETSEFVWRRLEEKIFGASVTPLTWWLIIAGVGAVGLFYVTWMYVRDSKSIGPWWAILLGLLRTTVYALLAWCFMMPAKQTWHESRTQSKVVLLIDSSLSISNTRDDLPPPGKTFKDMPTRQDKVLKFFNDPNVNFMGRLNEKNPVTTYRFSRGLDTEYLYFADKRFWPRSEHEKILSAKSKREVLPRGYRPDEEHWKSFLFPVVDEATPAVWTQEQADLKTIVAQVKGSQDIPDSLKGLIEKFPDLKGKMSDKKSFLEAAESELKASQSRGEEFLRQVRSNQTKVAARYFDATAIGESLLDVIKQERNQMVEGIIVYTDGRITEGSQSSIREASALAKDAGIPIFVVPVGETRPKVSIDIVDIGVPSLIRPEDKFRVVVTVNGQDMIPKVDTFDIFLDVTRFKRVKTGEVEKLIPQPTELVELDEKGQVLKDKKIPLKAAGQKITLTTKDAKEKPVFQAGNPPTAQVEFEIDGAKLAKAAGVDVMGAKVGLMPDADTEWRFIARIPKDKREVIEKTEHVSDTADMRVEEKALRVLLFTSSSGVKEFSFLRTLLVREEDKQRAEVAIHVQTTPGAERRTGIVLDVKPEKLLADFPTKRTVGKGDNDALYSLSSYDVVVAFDADWSKLSPEQALMLSDWVYKDGGGLIFIGGHMNTKEVASPLNAPKEGDDPKKPRNPFIPLVNMLPVSLEFSEKEVATTDVPRRLTFPQATAEMEYMRLDDTLPKDEWKKGWEKFFNEIQDEDGSTKMVSSGEEPERGFFAYYPTKKVKSNALRIAAIDAPTATLPGTTEKQPFMAQGPWGEGKVFWIASAEMWRLRMYKDNYHERFWTKMLREAGSKSVNTTNRRITPIMSRYGTVNKFQPFEARFEDINGQPLKRKTAKLPQLIVTEPEGVQVEKDHRVIIKDGEFAGKEAKVAEVITKKSPTGAEIRELKLTVFLDKADVKKTASTVLESKKVDIINNPIDFKPRLGEKDDPALDAKNDGWFKVEFQPKAAGEYKLKVIHEEGGDKTNVYNHKFIVRESNPELDNVKPDADVLWELASPAKKVLERVKSNTDLTAKLRRVLRAPEGIKPKEGDKKAEGEEVVDDSLRLLFTGDEAAKLIPDCMTQQRKDYRNRGKIDDLWDDGFEWSEVENDSGEKKPMMPYVLAVCVGLLSAEWLLRKLLRLA